MFRKCCAVFSLLTLIGGTSAAHAAGDPEFIDFVVKNAKKVGFGVCERAIREAFSNAGGSDINVNTDYFSEIASNDVTLTAIYGRAGDSVQQQTTITKIGKTCYSKSLTILTDTKSCTAYLNELPAFKYVKEINGHILAKNAGGIDLSLKPLNNGCVAIFQGNNKF